MTHVEAMKQALEALDFCIYPQPKQRNAVAVLRAAIEAAEEQESAPAPIGYLCENATGHRYFRWKKPSSVYKPIALYTTSFAVEGKNT